MRHFMLSGVRKDDWELTVALQPNCGHDLYCWRRTMALDQSPVEKHGPDHPPVVQIGAYDGHAIGFRHFAAQDMVLLERAEAARDSVISFAPSLADNLARAILPVPHS
jgi:hypothetical protein